ncbi:hypothetical protein CYY_003141 [Polysphondylium violaceum]|uniref:Carbohydrate binding domain-containing protein n=1 Tax=Polysphondylium violaceum TaxID=133409 RepID=A0A8J4V0E7_9MYCE|nr:hypothetical protein CYY_003141 [Polysphondylium violaceum]
MKVFVALLFALIAVSISSASANDFQCGVYRCPDMHACVCDAGVFRCVYRSQVEVSVKNVGHRMVKDVTIGTVGMNLKDNNAIWGISVEGRDIHLPSYVDLAPGQTHQFGYINKGNNAATLYVKNVKIN